MDEQKIVARLMGLTISVAQARRTFPSCPASLFYEVAPPSDTGRFLSFGQAFQIAVAHAQQEAREAKAAIAAAGHQAAIAERQAAAALPALDALAGVIDREVKGLARSLVARSAPPSAAAVMDRIAAVNARHADRARVRVERKGAQHVPS